MTGIDPLELGRLRWRCRRGMKELDLLLGRYVEERFCSAPNADQQAFRLLLEAQDTVIYGYFLGRETPPEALAGLIGRITASAPS